AAHLGVNPGTIYKWIERKQLPAHKVGSLWKFTATEVDEWVRAGKAAQDVPNTAKGASTKRKFPRR
ncbi:MAG: helix-turn-helix domain-containing protein, partial [Verrucomicrobiota bacterium]